MVASSFGIADSLTQSTLGGHRRGAFTGATESQVGLLAAANRGTLFLDEIGDAGFQLQGLLLEFLDHGTARQVGDVRSTPVDVRLIGATNAPLEQRIAEGQFRADLLYRFGYSQVSLPPLRDRRGDIPGLVAHFLDQCSVGDAQGRQFVMTAEAMEILKGSPWPDNIRGLKNAVEYAVDWAPDGRLDACHLPHELTLSRPVRVGSSLEERLARAKTCLAEAGGNVAAAARAYGVTRQHFYRIIRPLRYKSA